MTSTPQATHKPHFAGPKGAGEPAECWDLRGAARVIATDVNYGRELLLATARRQGAVYGCAPTNLREIANALAFVALARLDLRIPGDIEIADLIDRAVAEAAGERPRGDDFAQLSGRPGLLRLFRDSVLEVRMAGVSAAALKRAGPHGSASAVLADVLGRYEHLLTVARVADPAAVFALAVEEFASEAEYVLWGETLLVDGLSPRGLPGELMRKIRERGARLLERPPAASAGIDPSVVACDLFAAASIPDELREVCRRVLEEGLRWDQVEIVTTGPDEYGVALDALAQQLRIGATMLRGIPLARTRLGRAAERWLEWLENGLPADILREALEAGEVGLPESEVSCTALARELRMASIGWGRARYDDALASLKQERAVAALRQQEDESDADFAARRGSRQAVGAALASFLERLLAATPVVPARGSEAQIRTTAAAIARHMLAYLDLVSTHGQAEEQTMTRLRGRLEQLAELEGTPTAFSQALAAVRELLGDVRAWPLETAERKPWSSSGGMLHLTDVAHAGATGRPRIFVVGMDADRTAGPVRENPLLSDAARRALGASGLPTSAERRAEWDAMFAASLGALRGRVTLSYSTSASLDGREASPSPLLLATWRAIEGNDSLTYTNLRDALYPPASPVPGRRRAPDSAHAEAANADAVGREAGGHHAVRHDAVGHDAVGHDARGHVAGGHDAVGHIDGRDVWLDALSDGPLLLDGSAAVADAFPALAAGLRAHEAAQSPRASEFHGLVPDAGPLLDPVAAGSAVSPTALETQAACGLKWFYRYGLGIFPPVDPEYDPDQWLDRLERGSLLHEVFEAFTHEYKGKQAALDQPAARDRVLALAEDAIVKWRALVPPPSEAVFAGQSAELRRAALAFLQMERDRWAAGDRGVWSRFELKFGRENAAGAYELPDGAVLSIKGRADRVDVMPDGTLRVVDYKTGKPRGYGNDPKAGPFNGGRRLQPALYVPAVAAAEGAPVSRFEYRFPTDKGENEVIVYGAAALEPARAIIGDLVAQIRAGEFVPTDDPRDCTFCDYAVICRVAADGKSTLSPRAAWAKANGSTLPEYAKLIARRGRTTHSADDAEETE